MLIYPNFSGSSEALWCAAGKQNNNAFTQERVEAEGERKIKPHLGRVPTIDGRRESGASSRRVRLAFHSSPASAFAPGVIRSAHHPPGWHLLRSLPTKLSPVPHSSLRLWSSPRARWRKAPSLSGTLTDTRLPFRCGLLSLICISEFEIQRL